MERVFRDVKSLLATRPIFHQCGETIRGHVFFSFLALVLRKALQNRLGKSGYDFEWRHIKQDLKALQRVEIAENGHRFYDPNTEPGRVRQDLSGNGRGDAADDKGNLNRANSHPVVPRDFCVPVVRCYYLILKFEGLKISQRALFRGC